MPKSIASLSLDLDNKWSYMKTHGEEGWDTFPSYLDLVVPHIVELACTLDIKMTVFIVGQDAAIDKNRAALAMIPAAGFEVGNHSFHHEPWLHLYSEAELEQEFDRAEEAIYAATGEHPVGFRGPGFSLSDTTLNVLCRRGYKYDCSTFPTFLGPLARAYYFMTAKFDPDEAEQRKLLFGKFSTGFRPLRPYLWTTKQNTEARLVEIPVTTMPFFKLPVHVSYLLYLSQYSKTIALAYFRWALMLCRQQGINPSLLLHPLDFLGGDEESDLAFFPAMKLKGEEKRRFVQKVLTIFAEHYDIVPLVEHYNFIHGESNVRSFDMQAAAV